MKRRISHGFATAVLLAVLTAGCVPLGHRLGGEEVVAGRMEPDGHISEQVIGVPTEHHWMMLIAPDGPELNTVRSETWRFYLSNTNGQRSLLKFLQQRGGNVMPWNLITPVLGTDLWIGVISAGSLKRVEHGHFDYRVVCFTSKGITSEKTLDYSEYGTFHFDPETHTLIYEMKGKTQRYDPLVKTDAH